MARRKRSEGKPDRQSEGATPELPPGVKLLRTLEGHQGLVNSVSFDPPGEPPAPRRTRRSGIHPCGPIKVHKPTAGADIGIASYWTCRPQLRQGQTSVPSGQNAAEREF
jgi:hypothetical protein